MSDEIQFPLEVVNEDGTPWNFERPENPLKEKWARLYPPSPDARASQVCDGYSCMWCGRCPYGDYWKVPEEDKDVWEAYQAELKEYDRIHNPGLYAFYMKAKENDGGTNERT